MGSIPNTSPGALLVMLTQTLTWGITLLIWWIGSVLRIDLLKCPCGTAYHRVMNQHTTYHVAWAYGYHKQIWLCEGCGGDLDEIQFTDCLNSLVIVNDEEWVEL